MLNVCPDTNRCDVIADLRHTGDPESTINRIFDGTVSSLMVLKDQDLPLVI